METFSTLLALCAGNSLVTGEFPSQRPVTRSFDVFIDMRLNKRLSKQSRRRSFQTPLCSLWRHCSDMSVKYDLDHEKFRGEFWSTSEWDPTCIIKQYDRTHTYHNSSTISVY